MKPASPVTILLADDHPMFRMGLRDAIERNTDYILVGEAGDGEEALRLIEEKLPHVAILDVEMPKMNGLAVAERIDQAALPVSVIILTMYDEYALFNKALDAGVRGYILKESAVQDILKGIASIVKGEYFFSPALSGYLVRRAEIGGSANELRKELDILTAAERQILSLIAESRSSREIAERLTVSIRTVESHRYNICQKLKLSGSYALLRFALANKTG